MKCALALCFAILLVSSVEGQNEKACSNPGERWMEECNSCFCTEDGFAACTKKGCHGNIISFGGNKQKRDAGNSGSCTPGQEWVEKCNRCYCDDKRKPVCTRRLCGNEGPVIRLRRDNNLSD